MVTLNPYLGSATACAYDRLAERYDTLYRSRACRVENKLVARWLADLQEPVLDVGCGTGLLLELRPELSDYTGLDISPRMLEVARRNHPGRRWIEHDLNEDQPIEGGPFRSVVALFQSWNHVLAPEVALARLWEVTLPGAELYVVAHTPLRSRYPSAVPRAAGLELSALERQLWAGGWYVADAAVLGTAMTRRMEWTPTPLLRLAYRWSARQPVYHTVRAVRE